MRRAWGTGEIHTGSTFSASAGCRDDDDMKNAAVSYRVRTLSGSNKTTGSHPILGL